MRALLQRVARAEVRVGGGSVGRIGPGLLVLVGVGPGDSEATAAELADKVANLRIFRDPEGRTNLSLFDVGGEALVVSQFTLYADLRKGRRPSWTAAEDPKIAAERVEAFAVALESRGVRVSRGVFGADMQVQLVNDGPVTIWIDADRP